MTEKIRLVVLSLVGVVLSLGVAAAQAEVPELERNTALKKFQVDNDKFIGQRFVLRCPETNVRDVDEPLHGVDVYPSDSPLCVAASHAGQIDAAGGIIVVQLNPGAENYLGAERHGVSSTPFPQTPRSIVFVDPESATELDDVAAAYAPRIKWDTKFTATGLANRNLVGQSFLFKCPQAAGNLMPRRVYGTDQYAFNSYVCQAAVHAGRITHAGGYVQVKLETAQGKLQGSIRHGIESKNGPAGSRVISFGDVVHPVTPVAGG